MSRIFIFICFCLFSHSQPSTVFAEKCTCTVNQIFKKCKCILTYNGCFDRLFLRMMKMRRLYYFTGVPFQKGMYMILNINSVIYSIQSVQKVVHCKRCWVVINVYTLYYALYLIPFTGLHVRKMIDCWFDGC